MGLDIFTSVFVDPRRDNGSPISCLLTLLVEDDEDEDGEDEDDDDDDDTVEDERLCDDGARGSTEGRGEEDDEDMSGDFLGSSLTPLSRLEL